MKRFTLYLILALCAIVMRAAANDVLFPYPQPPADMERLDERADFIVSRFWRPCDFKSAMSKTDKLRATFNDWIGLMPYATADTVHAAIKNLLATVTKSGPQTLMLAQIAEESVYSDSAEYYSAEIFLPFAKAAMDHKKIPADKKAHFAGLVKKIENVQPGKPVGHLEFRNADGTKQGIDNFKTQIVAVVFNSHANSDSSLARVRLSADYNINKLIEARLLTVISLEPGEPTKEWLEAAASYPSNWIVGAAPDACEWFELPTEPTILLLDGRHRVLAKDVAVEGLMGAMERFRQQSGL